MCWTLSFPFYLLEIRYDSLFVHHKNFGLKNIDNLYGSYYSTYSCGVTMDILNSLESNIPYFWRAQVLGQLHSFIKCVH